MLHGNTIGYTYFIITKDWEASDLSVIPVTVHIPQNVPNHVKQWKLNLIYDILKPRVQKIA